MNEIKGIKQIKEIENCAGIAVYKSQSGGIGGRIKTIPEDFMVEEITPGGKILEIGNSNCPGDQTWGEYTHFVLQKYNWDTLRATKEISRRLRISNKRLGFAGTKDKKALTTQRVSVWNIPMDKLAEVEIKDMILKDFGYDDRPIKLGDLFGNRFTITIRDIDLKKDEILERIKKISNELNAGFPNFFGLQRFGSRRPITHLVGKEIIKGNLEDAVMIYLALVYEGESEEARNARSFLAETKDFKASLRKFPKFLSYESAMINHLVQHPSGYRGALNQLPMGLRTMFVHAYQAYIFNKTLSRYIKKGIPVEKLPLVGYETEIDEITSKTLDEEGITPEDFRAISMASLSSRGEYRDCWVPIQEFKALDLDIEKDELNEGKNKLKLRFSLPKGSYATVLLREFMKN